MKKRISVLILVFGPTYLALAEIKMKGSDILGAKMVPQLVELYQTLHPTIKFEITAEGSSLCFKALLDSSCDIGMASRPVQDDELEQFKTSGLLLKEHVVGHEIISVIVNAKNPIKELTLKQVEQIFTGETETWDELGGQGRMIVFTRNTTSSTHKTFQGLAMNGRNYGEKTVKLAGGESLPAEVSRITNAIGYSGLAYAKKDGIQAVAINGIEPSVANVNKYPISRNLSFYTVGEMKPEVRDFVRWVRNAEEAHSVIEQVGFIPLQLEETKEESPPKE